MSQFLGIFHSEKPRWLQGFYDAPYLMLNRHALCGKDCATDGNAAALAAGWVRNAPLLRRELREAGRPLEENASASELLLNAYRLWGEACVEKIEGPVVCAVVDQEADRLILAADRMGEAGSLFYAIQGESVVFAGRPDPILEAPGVSRTVNADGWREIFGLGPARTPGKTPFRDVCALPPGYMMVCNGKNRRVRRYFRLEARPHPDDAERTVERVRELTEQAVADVARFHPVAMLSGGLDSTVLTALLARHTDALRTYSVDYEENERHFEGGSYQPEQDAPYVEKAVRLIGCSHTRVVLRVESLADALLDAMRARGFPGMADVDASLLLFSRRIAAEARCVVSGECSDEVFGGYPWFHREALVSKDGFPWSGSIPLRESILTEEAARALNLGRFVEENYRDALRRQERLPGEDKRDARLRQIQGLCFEYFMSNLQERASAMGDAAGLTVFTPYCDDRLVQYVYNVPWRIKALDGREKGLLRAAMRSILPDDLLWRKKSPYPKTYHPLYTQLIKEMIRSVLSEKNAPILQLVRRDAVERLAEGPLSPVETPWFGQLMTGPQMLAYLIQVNQWMLKYRVEVDL